MSRCNSTEKLEVHHKRRDGGNGIENAEVLCHDCHVKTGTYGVNGKSPVDFTDEIIKAAKKRAGYRCECDRENCHISLDERTRNIIDAVKMPKYYL